MASIEVRQRPKGTTYRVVWRAPGGIRKSKTWPTMEKAHLWKSLIEEADGDSTRAAEALARRSSQAMSVDSVSDHRMEHSDGAEQNRFLTRAERRTDIPAIRAINEAAFPSQEEADLVDNLRADDEAWIDGLSIVTTTDDDAPVGHALLSRCQVGDSPALALAPCAVLPEYQHQGYGSAAVRAAIEAARSMEERLVIVLGHPDYYPKFGFVPASRLRVTAPFEVPDDAFMALQLHPGLEAPSGRVQYASAFGI